MLELLLSAGAKKAATFWPDSGPGTKMLQFGDQTAGYFGEVSSAELYTNVGVYALAQFSGGTLYPGDISWLKFFIDGKVVYYAKQQVGANLCWNDVYSAGCALGIRGIGPYPVGAGVDQFRLGTVTEGNRDWTLLLRMPKTGLSDPALVDTTNVLQSEWNRTIMRVVNGGWGTYTPTDLGRTTDMASMCLETWTNSTTWHYVRGATNNAESRSNIAKTQNNLWRPVLELVDATKIAFDPRNIEYLSTGLIPPSINNGTVATDVIYSLNGFHWTNALNNRPSITEIAFADVANPPTAITYTGAPLNEFGVVIDDADVVPPQTFIWDIGPLSEFGFTTETI